LTLIAFVGLILVVICLLHYYLWKRLVKDPIRSRKARSVGTVVAALLTLLAPATLIGVRSGYVEWLAWPGYLWIALMFYLFVTLLVLEIPRLVITLWIRATAKRAARSQEPAAVSPAARGGTSATSADETSARATTGPADGSAAPASASAAPTTGAQPTSATSAGAQASAATAGAQPASATPASAQADSAATSGTQPEASTPTGSASEDLGINRRLLLARGAAIFAGLTAAGITGYGVKTALGPPQLDRVQLPLAKLPRAMDGTRLAVVSDIHLGPLTGTNHAARIVSLINSVNADIVCVVGDLVDGSVAELGRFAAPLAGIESRKGAYFVTGNHEYYSGFQEWVDEVARLGIRPLRNERLSLDGLDLAGVNDLGGEEFGDGPDLQRALGDRDTGRPVVLMAHQPIVARDAAPFGVDLQVSGHTHGGQMAPFNLLVQLEQPVVSGFGKVDGVPVYVTNGAGFWGPPVRVGAPPQVTVIELRTP
jgi:predicted MPP superfamily phosphohydrolase